MEDMFWNVEFIASDELTDIVMALINSFADRNKLILTMKYGINERRQRFSMKEIIAKVNEDVEDDFLKFTVHGVKKRIGTCQDVIRTSYRNRKMALLLNDLEVHMVHNKEERVK